MTDDRGMGPLAASLRLVFGIGVATVSAAVAGTLLTWLLTWVQHTTLGYTSGTFGEAFDVAPVWRRLVGPSVGGVVAGLGWWWLRRSGTIPRPSELVSSRTGLATAARVVVDAVLQILAVGTGASVGREGAPRQMAAVVTDQLIGRVRVPRRRLLLASAAGASLAAVYTTPVAGALFAMEVVLAEWSLAGALIALAISFGAVGAAWPITREAPTYHWPAAHLGAAPLFLPVLVAVPAILVGIGFRALTARASTQAIRGGWRLPVSIGLAGLVLGGVACFLPTVPGNGKAVLQGILRGDLRWWTLALLVAVKPLATAMFLLAGARGGLLTPSMATGGALGAALAVAVGQPSAAAPCALCGAAVVLTIAQRAPWFSAVFSWELAHPPVALFASLLVAALLAHHASLRLAPLIRTRSLSRHDGVDD